MSKKRGKSGKAHERSGAADGDGVTARPRDADDVRGPVISVPNRCAVAGVGSDDSTAGGAGAPHRDPPGCRRRRMRLPRPAFQDLTDEWRKMRTGEC